MDKGATPGRFAAAGSAYFRRISSKVSIDGNFVLRLAGPNRP